MPSSLILELLIIWLHFENHSSLQYFDGPSIQMGNNSQIQAKGKDSIKLEDGNFKDVIYVPSLVANL